MFNKTQEELSGLNVFDLLPPKVVGLRKKMLEEVVLASRPLTFDDEYDGRVVRSTIYPYKSKDDKADRFLILAQNITARKIAEETLLNSEERFKALFNSQSAIQVLLDPDTGKVLDVNQKAVEWYGWSAEELKQMYARDINCLSQEDVEKSLKTVDARQHNIFTGRHKRADGSIRDVEVYRNKIELGGTHYIHAITHDITDRKLAEAELERKSRALLLSDQCNNALIHAQDEDVLLKQICGTIVDTGGYRMAWVGYAEQDITKKIRPVSHAGFVDGYLETLQISWADDKYGHGPAGSAIRTRQPCSIHNVQEDPHFYSWRDQATSRGYTSILSIPLIVDDNVLGVLTVYSELPDPFHAAEKKQLMSIAENLAFGINMLRNRKALRESEERFRTLFERNTSINILIDLGTGDIIDANRAAGDFYGWSIDELRGMNISQLNPELESYNIKGNLEKFSSAGHAKFLFRHLMKDGTIRYVETFSTKMNDGNKDFIYAIIHDVTDHKHYEDVNEFRLRILQMAENHSVEELLISTIDEAEKITGSSIGFVFFVAADQNSLLLQTVSTNTFQNMCKAEGKGQHYPLDKAGVWADAVREKKAIIHNDYPSLKHRKGMPEGHAEIKRELVIPVNRDGKIVAIIGVGNKLSDYGDKDIEWLEIIANYVWDIVAKKMADEETKRLAEQLRHAAKMEMIGQLAAGIAHEINNPLNFIAINGHTQSNDFKDLQEMVAEYREIIDKYIAVSADAKEVSRLREKEKELDIDYLLGNIPKTLEMTKHGVERITAIIRSMRNYSFKNELGVFKPSDINKAVHESLLIAKSEYRDVATVDLRLEELPTLMCDVSLISQVMLNLIVNSAQAIKSQNRSTPGTITIKTWATGESIFCTVADDGPGMPERTRSRIFEPFFTTKDIGKGTGLGLSISYDIIVNTHHGNISAECPAEGGTVFTISLPKNSAEG